VTAARGVRARLRTLVEQIVDARLAAVLPAVEERAAQAGYLRGRAAALTEPHVWGPPGRLRIADSAIVNDALLNTESGSITIGSDAFFGHRVSVLTGTHDVSRRGRERQQAVPSEGRDIVVEEGAWIGSGATLVGPCRIGAHAVVAAGAVVTADVARETVVAGVPARVVRTLADGERPRGD
jgi:acetyltransferase-like isoleucine patch superfamily enzyme